MSDYPVAIIRRDGTRVEWPKEYWLSPGVPIVREPRKYKPEDVAVSAWDECGISDLPCACGVYAIQIPSRSMEFMTIYIGSSACLSHRLVKHEVIKELVRVGIDFRVLIHISLDYAAIEQRAIRKHQPPLNIAHNKDANKEVVSLFFGRKQPLKRSR